MRLQLLMELVEVISAKPLLTRKDLARHFCKSVDTIDYWHRRGILPAPVYLPGCRYPFWRPVDIQRVEMRWRRHRPKGLHQVPGITTPEPVNGKGRTNGN